jgi:C1A family cysteine protease
LKPIDFTNHEQVAGKWRLQMILKQERESRSLGRQLIFITVCLILLPAVLSYSAEIDQINDAIKAKGAEWVARENPMSLLPMEEKVKRLGALEELDVGAVADQSFYIPLVVLPTAFDWRNDNGGNYVTPVRNQGSCGSCWAFATTAALESKALITFNWPGSDLNLSEQIVLSCSGAGNCEQGGYASTASDFLRDTGTSQEICYPYSAQDGDCRSACTNWDHNVYRFQNWSYVVSGSAATVNAIKNALYTSGPVVAWFRVYDDFSSYGGGVYSHTTGNYLGNHYVLVVGWNDLENAFVVKNSWGTSWGESGYFRISYTELAGITQFGRWTYAYGDTVRIGGWVNVPGRTVSSPALAWNPSANKLQMVVRAVDDSLWLSSFNSAGAFNNDWTSIPGKAASSPALAWNPSANKLQMVVRAADDSLWLSSFNSAGAFNDDWTSIPGKTPSSPSLAWNPAANELQIVVRADDNSLWAGTFNSSGIFNNDWAHIPGATPSTPSLAWDALGSEVAMGVRGSDGSIWFATFNSSGTFNDDWGIISGLTPSSPGMASLPSGYLNIVIRSSDNSLWRILY